MDPLGKILPVEIDKPEGSVVLALPFPPSVNHCYGHAAFSIVYATKKMKDYKQEVLAIVSQARAQKQMPRAVINQPIMVTSFFYPPDRRRRDIDNYFKVLLDALTNAGVWKDDKLIFHKNSWWMGFTTKGNASVKLVISWGTQQWADSVRDVAIGNL